MASLCGDIQADNGMLWRQGGAQNPSQHTQKNTSDHTLPTLHYNTPKRTQGIIPFQSCISTHPKEHLWPHPANPASIPLHQAPLECSPGWEQLSCTAPGRDQPFHRPLSSSLTLPFCPRDLETGLSVSRLNRTDPPPPSVSYSWPAMLAIQGEMFHSPL